MSGLLIIRARKLVTPTHCDTLELDVATYFLWSQRSVYCASTTSLSWLDIQHYVTRNLTRLHIVLHLVSLTTGTISNCWENIWHRIKSMREIWYVCMYLVHACICSYVFVYDVLVCVCDASVGTCVCMMCLCKLMCTCVLITVEAIKWCHLKEMSLLSFMRSFDIQTTSLEVYTDLNPTPCRMSYIRREFCSPFRLWWCLWIAMWRSILNPSK